MPGVCRFWMLDGPFVWDLGLKEYLEDIRQSGSSDGAESFGRQPLDWRPEERV